MNNCELPTLEQAATGRAYMPNKAATADWATPPDFFAMLDQEFNFDFDPCPLGGLEKINDSSWAHHDGLRCQWGHRNYVNPPYGPAIGAWCAKAWAESQAGRLCVMLLPARTDTIWWHEYAMLADEIRFVRGRLKFGNADNSATFPSVVLVFSGKGRLSSGAPVIKSIGRK